MQATVASVDSYDEVPYTSYPYDRTHPDRLHTIATLFGASPAPIDACRVLELGCASGGNLMPMAELFPGTEFVGIDRSRRQIEAGRKLAEHIGLPNLDLRLGDILEVDGSWGEFDYIICHGVYSWVGSDVQAKILEIMDKQLTPSGVGYVSYNVYPGWHLREMVRHMMLYHVRNLENPQERLTQARALIDFLGQHVPASGSAYGMSLHKELELLRKVGNDYVYHEHLEAQNRPVYFHEFAERLAARGLRYVGETDVDTMLMADDDIARTLRRVASDIVTMEQYMDFVRNRQFRASVVCRQEVELRRDVQPAVVFGRAFEFAGLVGDTPVDLAEGVSHEFVSASEIKMTTDRPITKAAFVILRQSWPRAVRFSDLVERSVALLREAGVSVAADAREHLAADLLGCCFGGGVRIRSWVPPIARGVPPRPRVSRVARAQAAHGDFATSLHHRAVPLNRAQKHIIQLLDGTRDRQRLCADVGALVAAGALDLTRNGERIRDPEEMKEPLTAVLDQTLLGLAANAMLLDGERSGVDETGRGT